MSRPRTVIYALCGLVAALGCGQNLGGPELFRPIVRVNARDFSTGQQSSSLKVGETTRLVFMVYSATDSLSDPAVVWISRNPSIAGNLGSTVTGRASGTTYIIGEVFDAGNAYRDSVQVTVSP